MPRERASWRRGGFSSCSLQRPSSWHVASPADGCRWRATQLSWPTFGPFRYAPAVKRRLSGVLGIPGVLALLLVGCGGAGQIRPEDNQVFYHRDLGADGDGFGPGVESPYPPLDHSRPDQAYKGVTVLQGIVRLSRPEDWTIRAASLEPERRFIQYASPRQILFTVYERIESPRDPWHLVMGRYQQETTDQGGVFLGPGFPGAVWNAQTRVYDVNRLVPAPKAAFRNYSREYLVRGSRRFLLVQVVRPEESLESVSDEVLRTVDTLQVL